MNTYLRRCIFFLILFVIAVGPVRAADSGTEPQRLERATEAPLHMTLEQAIDLALKANRGLTASADAVTFSRLSLQSAESDFEVKFVPTLNSAVSSSEDDADTDSATTVEGSVEKKFELGPKAALIPRVGYSDEGEYTTGVGAQLNLPLFKGLGREVNRNAVDTARFNLRGSETNNYLTRDRTVLETVTAVYTVLKQQRLLEFFTSQVETYKRHAESARVKEKAGLASPIDVYRAEISVKDAEDDLSRTEKNLSDAENTLKLILTIPLEMTLSLTAPVKYEPLQLDLPSALTIALESRVELVRARDRLEDAQRRSRIAKHGLLPDVNLVMDYARTGTAEDFSQSTNLDQDNWRVALFGSTSLPRSEEKAAYQQSLLAIKTARLALEQERDDINREVRAQLDALKEFENSIAIREAQKKTAEGKLALSEIKFRYAMTSNFDVIESENELGRATVDLLTARTDHIVGMYRLRSVLGTLVE